MRKMKEKGKIIYNVVIVLMIVVFLFASYNIVDKKMNKSSFHGPIKECNLEFDSVYFCENMTNSTIIVFGGGQRCWYHCP